MFHFLQGSFVGHGGVAPPVVLQNSRGGNAYSAKLATKYMEMGELLPGSGLGPKIRKLI